MDTLKTATVLFTILVRFAVGSGGEDTSPIGVVELLLLESPVAASSSAS